MAAHHVHRRSPRSPPLDRTPFDAEVVDARQLQPVVVPLRTDVGDAQPTEHDMMRRRRERAAVVDVQSISRGTLEHQVLQLHGSNAELDAVGASPEHRGSGDPPPRSPPVGRRHRVGCRRQTRPSKRRRESDAGSGFRRRHRGTEPRRIPDVDDGLRGFARDKEHRAGRSESRRLVLHVKAAVGGDATAGHQAPTEEGSSQGCWPRGLDTREAVSGNGCGVLVGHVGASGPPGVGWGGPSRNPGAAWPKRSGRTPTPARAPGPTPTSASGRRCVPARIAWCCAGFRGNGIST